MRLIFILFYIMFTEQCRGATKKCLCTEYLIYRIILKNNKVIHSCLCRLKRICVVPFASRIVVSEKTICFITLENTKFFKNIPLLLAVETLLVYFYLFLSLVRFSMTIKDEVNRLQSPSSINIRIKKLRKHNDINMKEYG